MKNTLSLLFALLMVGSALSACGKTDPNPSETSGSSAAVETTVGSETASAETEAPARYDASLIAENGIAKAHIVIPNEPTNGADPLLGYGAAELTNHIMLVSGADVTVTDTVQAGSLPIIIATPDNLPELEELFPEDLAWLRDLGNPDENTRFGDDGFAIRQLNGKLYIFGATPRGALNGVYDFIEENLGVLWIRAENMVENSIIYDQMPSVTVTKADYREKSPFNLRSWTLSGNSWESEMLLSRNKLNAFATTADEFIYVVQNGGYTYDNIGLEPFITNHNIKWWIQNSPSYDPDCDEYWSTDIAGNRASSASESSQVNFWSQLTADTIADSVIAFLDKYQGEDSIQYIGICPEDFQPTSVYPEMNEPYEYAPGQFVKAGSTGYLSTVFFSFLNKIAESVGNVYPDVKLHTYAYEDFLTPPLCEPEENLYITVCPISEDLCSPIGESTHSRANLAYQALLGWMDLTSNVQVYNYYGCYEAGTLYERPIWDRIQSDLQLYAENGFNGLVPEGLGDVSESIQNICQNTYSMNTMTNWIYSKLAWNPNEDVDALMQYYCEKVYGEAAEYVLEYYRLLELGWKDGNEAMTLEFNLYYSLATSPDIYWDYFLNIEVDGVNIYEAIVDVLHKAYDAADEVGKEHLRYSLEVYDNAEALFFN